jgi:hypothetical protein
VPALPQATRVGRPLDRQAHRRLYMRINTAMSTTRRQGMARRRRKEAKSQSGLQKVVAFQSLIEPHDAAAAANPSHATWTKRWEGLSGDFYAHAGLRVALSGMDMLRAHVSTAPRSERQPGWPDSDATCFYHCAGGGHPLHAFEWDLTWFDLTGSTKSHLMPASASP